MDFYMIEQYLTLAGEVSNNFDFMRIPQNQFLTAAQFSTSANLVNRFPSSGIPNNTANMEWFFINDRERGEFIMIPSLAIRYNVSYTQAISLPSSGLNIAVDGMIWNYSLMRGVLNDATGDWDRYITYGLWADRPVNSSFPKRWASLTLPELGLTNGQQGLSTMVRPSQQAGKAFARGGEAAQNGPLYIDTVSSSEVTPTSFGFRPILRLVSGKIPWYPN